MSALGVAFPSILGIATPVCALARNDTNNARNDAKNSIYEIWSAGASGSTPGAHPEGVGSNPALTSTAVRSQRVYSPAGDPGATMSSGSLAGALTEPSGAGFCSRRLRGSQPRGSTTRSIPYHSPFMSPAGSVIPAQKAKPCVVHGSGASLPERLDSVNLVACDIAPSVDTPDRRRNSRPEGSGQNAHDRSSAAWYEQGIVCDVSSAHPQPVGSIPAMGTLYGAARVMSDGTPDMGRCQLRPAPPPPKAGGQAIHSCEITS